MAYVEVTITGYNSNPPPDDGSTGVGNKASWAKIKTALFDPVRDGLERVNSNISTAITTADADLATLQAGVASATALIAGIGTALKGPSGTGLLFRQEVAPTGWTKSTAYNDYALRLVTGDAATGGSTAFSSVFTARTIATENMPAHTHDFSQSTVSASFSGTNGTSLVYNVTQSSTVDIESGGSRTYYTSISDTTSAITGTFSATGTSSSIGSGTAMDFAVMYVDTIYATRN